MPRLRKPLSEASKLEGDRVKFHEIFLPSPKKGVRTRYNTDEYTYISQHNESEHPGIQVHFAYISCLVHYPILNDLKTHIDDIHLSAQSTTNESHDNHYDTSPRKWQCRGDKDGASTIANSKNTLFNFVSPVLPYQSLEAYQMTWNIYDLWIQSWL